MLALALAILIASSAPVPEQLEGFTRGSGLFNLDVYYSNLCKDSASQYPALAAFFAKNSDWLRLNMHFITFPYHNHTLVVH